MAGITGRGAPEAPFDLRLDGEASCGATLGRWRALIGTFPDFGGAVVARQVHGTRLQWHGSVEGWLIGPDGDGHATARPGVLLTVSVADCVPIYLADPARRAVALLHAGWRGTADRILAAGVQMLTERAGSDPTDLAVHFGVGICGGCYEVGRDVLLACGSDVPPEGRALLDLRGVLARQAADLGIRRVSTSPRCSAHDRGAFFSHRAEAGRAGRMVAYLGIPA